MRSWSSSATSIPPPRWPPCEQAFGGIPNHPVPPRPAVNLQPVRSEAFTLDSNLPYALGFIAFRLSRNERRRLRGGAGPRRRAEQPARRPVRDGAGRQSARRGVRAGGNLSAGEHRLRPRGAAGAAEISRAQSRTCARSCCAMRNRASRKSCSRRPNAASWPGRNFSATRSRDSPICGRMLWRPRAGLLRMRTSTAIEHVTLADVNRAAEALSCRSRTPSRQPSSRCRPVRRLPPRDLEARNS